MSELKVIDLGNIRESIEKDEPVYYEYYAKSEADKVIAHNKYKRCLAMAKICENKLGTVVKPGWWNKWHKRWLEIAEKIKEGV